MRVANHPDETNALKSSSKLQKLKPEPTPVTFHMDSKVFNSNNRVDSVDFRFDKENNQEQILDLKKGASSNIHRN